MVIANANVTLDKPAVRLFLAGTEQRNVILAGLSGKASIPLRTGEKVRSITITATGFSESLTWTTSGTTATSQTIVFGTHTDTSDDGVRNTITWVTNKGTRKRQFWVKNLPSSGALYIKNTVADGAGNEAVCYVNLEAGAGDWEKRAHFSIAILPTFNDEHFILGEAATNRYANTLRPWGGAATAEVFFDDMVNPIITEQDIADIHGYFCDFSSYGYGAHDIRVRLRAATGSSNYVDINGTIRARQFD